MRANPSTAAGRAPGKVILVGEHAVVYGRTAIAAAIDHEVEVTVVPARGPAHLGGVPQGADARLSQVLQRACEVMAIEPRGFRVEVRSGVPIGVGLGSSAAFSVALLRAMAGFAGNAGDDDSLCAGAFELEKIFHGYPSGIDNTVATYGGLIAFRHGAPTRSLHAAAPIPLVIAMGRAARQTQGVVAALRERWRAAPACYEALFDDIDALATAAEEAITAGAHQVLGELMNRNHTLLRALGVSTDELDHLVSIARVHGAWGAKLTGGGGGGAIICVPDSDPTDLLAALQGGGWSAFAATITAPMRGHDAFEQTSCPQ